MDSVSSNLRSNETPAPPGNQRGAIESGGRNGRKERGRFKFRLYVAGNAPNSVEAVRNLRALCRSHLQEDDEIEIVDVLRDPNRARAEGVVLTPMLVRLLPSPILKILGGLNERETVLRTLGLSGDGGRTEGNSNRKT